VLLIASLSASLLAGCGTTSSMRFEGSWQVGKVTLAAPGALWPWTIQSGSDNIALLMYRHEGSSDRTADNEEFVVGLTMTEFTAGKPVDLESPGRIVCYQRGGQKLGYASTTVKGSLSFQRDGDRVRGQVTLSASAPSVNINGGSGDVSRQFSFDLGRK
jgi:hypothetical protein